MSVGGKRLGNVDLRQFIAEKSSVFRPRLHEPSTATRFSVAIQKNRYRHWFRVISHQSECQRNEIVS
jgi:hypothetical protein